LLYAVESDLAKVAEARRRLDAAGLYGTRVVVHHADPADPPYPKYFANLIVSARALSDGTDWLDKKTLQKLQRPFGGVACLGRQEGLLADRRGPLESGGSWTHQNADPANTLCSTDRIRGPLSMLWYREVDFEVPDRHAQAPAPLFSRGYLVSEGVDGLCTLDAYNGRILWTYPLDGVLKDYDGVHHDVGVGDTGSNYCLSDDSVYVRTSDRCLRLDLVTGERLAEWTTPVPAGERNHAWGYLAYHNGILFGTVCDEEHKVSPRYGDIRLYTESVLLFALDPQTGKVLWQYKPRHSIRNNAIAAAGNRLYLIDRPLALADRIENPQPNGKHRPKLAPGEHPGGMLVALDAAKGKVLWQQEEDIFGTQLAVSDGHGVLLMYYQAVRHNFFRLPSEIGGRMAAFETAGGRRLWDQPAQYTTRPIINAEKIIAEGGAWELKTGKPLSLRVERTYGCGQFSACENLILFRSGTLGYRDLTRDAGTENFGGMRPGCWFNAIPAGGLVLVPDASAKCACSYQMHAWFALQGAE
jgi:outer membrane protein assembly factor BamB